MTSNPEMGLPIETGININLVDDRFIRFIRDRIKLPPVLLWALTSFCLIVLFGLIAAVYGDLKSHDGVTGYLDDYGGFVNFLIGTPAMIVFYVLLPGFFSGCLKELVQNDIIRKPRQAYFEKYGDDYSLSKFLTQVRASFNLRIWYIGSFVISAGFVALAIPSHLMSKTWGMQHIVSLVLYEITWFLLFSVTILFAFRVLISIYWINQVFKRFEINVRPLYPDGAGGLQPLSRFSIQLSYVLFFFGLELTLNQVFTSAARSGTLGAVTWEADLVVPWLAYLILSPIVFFAPIGAAHDAMREAKHAELLRISRRFDTDYRRLWDQLNKSPEEVEKLTRQISELRKLYDMVAMFPVWPFQFQKLAQFSATILAPLVLTILTDMLTQYVSGLLGN